MDVADFLRDRGLSGQPLPPVVRAMFSLSPRKVLAWGSLVLLFLYMQPFSTVPTGYRGVITQFGAIKGIEPEGLVILPPWKRLTSFNIRAETVMVQKAEGATSDTQPVHVGLAVRYSIRPDKVSEVFEKYSRNGDLTSYVETATQEAFKSVTARYSAPDLIAQRTSVSADVWKALQAKLDLYGAKVVNIDMTQFAFSPEYMNAINDKTTQAQKRMAAENKAKTVEAEQKQQVIIAEATAQSVRAKADGDAYATLTNAKAKAESMRIQNQALQQNRDVLEVLRIEVEKLKAEKWNGQLPQNIYAGAPIPFLQMESGKRADVPAKR